MPEVQILDVLDLADMLNQYNRVPGHVHGPAICTPHQKIATELRN